MVEGTCGSLVKDRMEQSGMRWSIHGAQAVLAQRAVVKNGDWDSFFTYYIDAERDRLYPAKATPEGRASSRRSGSKPIIDSANFRDYYRKLGHLRRLRCYPARDLRWVEHIQGEMKMADTASLQIGDQTLELPIIVGSEDEKALDISKLRAETGYITIDPGYGNTGSCQSDITFIVGTWTQVERS